EATEEDHPAREYFIRHFDIGREMLRAGFRARGRVRGGARGPRPRADHPAGPGDERRPREPVADRSRGRRHRRLLPRLHPHSSRPAAPHALTSHPLTPEEGPRMTPTLDDIRTLRLVWPQWQGAGRDNVASLLPGFPLTAARHGYVTGSR